MRRRTLIGGLIGGLFAGACARATHARNPDLEAGGFVDDLVATAGLTEPFLDG